jgi:hypothetical protein
VTEFDSVVPAGGTGTLTAKIKTTSVQHGPISKSVAVTTDAPGAQRLMLNVKFTAVSLVSVLPRAQMNLRGVKGEVAETSVVLRRGDGKPLEVTDIESTDDRIVITTEQVLEERQVGRQKARIGDVVITAKTTPDLQPVMANGRFSVRTNHPDAEPVDIVYAIRLLPTIEARPDRVRLILQEGNDPARSALLKVQHNRRGTFRLTGVKASKPELIQARLIDGDREQKVHNVAVSIQDDVAPGSLTGRVFGSIVLTTDDPQQPEVTVVVHIEPRELRRPGQAAPAG